MMKSYKAYVRVPFNNGTVVVETMVMAIDVNAAMFLLRAQYGQDNLTSIPTLID
jgi:hypothetical protein